MISINPISVTDGEENLEKKSIVQDLKTVRCITYNIQLDKCNEEMSALPYSGSEANLISWLYAAQLPPQIWNTSLSIATINK